MEKIVIPYTKPVRVTHLSGVIRISPEAESILRRMCRDSGVPISKIASAIIEQGAELVEFVPLDQV